MGDHNSYTGCQVDYQGENYHWIKETSTRAAQLQHQGISTPLDPGTPDGYNTYPKPREESRPLDVATPTIPHVEINAEACCKGLGSRERGSGSRHQLHDCGYGAAEIQHRGMSDRAILRLFSGA